MTVQPFDLLGHRTDHPDVSVGEGHLRIVGSVVDTSGHTSVCPWTGTAEYLIAFWKGVSVEVAIQALGGTRRGDTGLSVPWQLQPGTAL
jgi:hypothetical protein